MDKDDTSPVAYLFSDENNKLGDINVNYISSLYYKGRTLNGLYYHDENNVRRDFAYDDTLTKDIQDDLIKVGLTSVTKNSGANVTFTLKNAQILLFFVKLFG